MPVSFVMSFRLSVRLSACISAAPNGRISVKFDTGDHYEKSVEKNSNLSKIEQKTPRTLNEDDLFLSVIYVFYKSIVQGVLISP
jgi:hypothetical protein